MVSDKKTKLVQKLAEMIKEYPLVGVVNMENLPTQQLQKMREMFRNKGVFIVMTRKKLLKLALQQSGHKNIEQLIETVKGMPALIFSKGNPFTLYSTIQKNKSEAPAKAGQTAPKDIIVKAGATSFAPGPIISELAAVGIKTKVENGKLAIISDVTVAKEGDEVSPKLAETLKRLDIKPMEIGLDLVAVWENGLIFAAKQLRVDEAEYFQNFVTAAQEAMNLAVEAAYFTDDTTEILLQKAFREAKAVALESSILNDDTKEEILAKAEAQANAVKDAGKIETNPAPTTKKVEVKAEEKPVEKVKKEEPKAEITPAPVEEKKEEVVEEPKVEEKQPATEEKLDLVKETKEKFKEEPKVEDNTPKAEDLIKQTKERFEHPEKFKAEKEKKDNFAQHLLDDDSDEEEQPQETAQDQEESKEEEVEEKKEALVEEKQEVKEEKIQPKEETKKQSHPKQGSVDTKQAEDLFKKLQQKGTLRD